MRIGIVGDMHLPFAHPMYLTFCQDMFAQWDIDHVHFAGDVVDLHALSFHDHDPSGHSAERESELAHERLVQWKEAFPVATVSIGNHDERHYRRARKNGIPDRYLKTYQDVWGTPGWNWNYWHIHDGVLYEHGTGSSGKDMALNRAMQKRLSIVVGHVHSYGGVKWHTNERSRIFGLNVGCGVDCQSYAFEYGRNFPVRPTLGCGIVLDGCHAYFEMMPCAKRETYHRSRA